MIIVDGERKKVKLSEFAHGKSVGLECPKCGCADFEVSNTRPKNGYVWRRKRCLNCGTKVTTSERIVGKGNSG